MARKIIQNLNKEDIQRKLDSIYMMKKLPKMPRDSKSRQLKIYDEANNVLKTLYIAVARAIMQIIDSNYSGFHDKTASYNYESPNEPVAAAEAIQLLPNAFIGGPIKSAINSTDPKVQMTAINYFESLPNSIKISSIFPDNFSLAVKKLKQKLSERSKPDALHVDNFIKQNQKAYQKYYL
jgi:hypothetical protein